jgi:hypothetical protein
MTDYTDWELNFVRANTTLMIGTGQTFPTVTAAWNYALNARVADGSYLHFYISSANGNFSQTFTSTFLLDHVSGPRMAILGDNQANDTLIFNCPNAFVVDTGHSFNTLSGFQLENIDVNDATTAIKANLEATISAVANMTVTGFGTDVFCGQDASITIDGSTTLVMSGDTGIDSETGGSVICPQGLTITATGMGIAFYANYGGQISAPGSTVSQLTDGVDASNGAIVNISGGTVSHCTFGCIASNRAYINSSDSHLSSNTTDLYAEVGGYINAAGATYTSSGTGLNDGSYVFN